MIVAEVYRLYTEANYNATTKSTGAGQAQVWDNTSALGGLNGDVKVTIGSTTVVSASGTFSETGTNSCSIRQYFDFSSLTLPTNKFMEFFNLFVTPGVLSRVFIRNISGSVYLWIHQHKDGGAFSVGNTYAIGSLAPNYFESTYVRASTDMSADGTVTHRTGNEGLLGTQSGIDNYDYLPQISKAVVGGGLQSGSIDASISGDFWLGKLLVTNDANPIGPIILGNPQLYLRRRRRSE